MHVKIERKSDSSSCMPVCGKAGGVTARLGIGSQYKRGHDGGLAANSTAMPTSGGSLIGAVAGGKGV